MVPDDRNVGTTALATSPLTATISHNRLIFLAKQHNLRRFSRQLLFVSHFGICPIMLDENKKL
jgi:hypothetical protein